MYDQAISLIDSAQRIVIIQPENPDGDSLGSSLALEEILGDKGKQVTMYCRIEIPKYMRYINGWDRVVSTFDLQADLAIIVDTTADNLLDKTLAEPGVRSFLESHPVLVIDHHDGESNLSFPHTILEDEAVATSEVIFKLAHNAQWDINQQAAKNMLASIMADSLGLTTQNVTSDVFRIVAHLIDFGASPAELEAKRREYMKKSPEILAYKGELIRRIEYFLDGKLALIHIPWEDIHEYSDQFNPSILVLDEMRLVVGVDVAIAIKTYPDGKLTGKLRSNIPVSGNIAGFFGGGGHAYSAGFKINESYDNTIPELLHAADDAIKEYYVSDHTT